MVFAWIIAISFRVHEIISRWLSIAFGIFKISSTFKAPAKQKVNIYYRCRWSTRNINLRLCLIISLSLVRDHRQMRGHKRRNTWKGMWRGRWDKVPARTHWLFVSTASRSAREKNWNFVDFRNKLYVIKHFICVHVERVNNKILKVETLESKQQGEYRQGKHIKIKMWRKKKSIQFFLTIFNESPPTSKLNFSQTELDNDSSSRSVGYFSSMCFGIWNRKREIPN